MEELRFYEKGYHYYHGLKLHEDDGYVTAPVDGVALQGIGVVEVVDVRRASAAR